MAMSSTQSILNTKHMHERPRVSGPFPDGPNTDVPRHNSDPNDAPLECPSPETIVSFARGWSQLACAIALMTTYKFVPTVASRSRREASGVGPMKYPMARRSHQPRLLPGGGGELPAAGKPEHPLLIDPRTIGPIIRRPATIQ